MSETTSAKHWLFQANESYFDITRALRELDEITWLANQHADKLEVGQTGLLWMSGGDGGVVAFGTLVSEVETQPLPESEQPYVVEPGKFEDDKPRVRVRIDRVLERPISRQAALHHPLLSSLQVIRMPTQTNYIVSPEEYEAIEELADSSQLLDELEASLGDEEVDAAEAIADLLPDERRRAWVADRVSEAVAAANDANPNGWEFTLRRDSGVLRINAGWLAMFTVRKEGLHLTIPESAGDAIDPDIERRFPFKKEREAMWVELPWDQVEALWPSLEAPLLAEMVRHSSNCVRTPYWYMHSFEALDELSQYATNDIPQPGYLSALLDRTARSGTTDLTVVVEQGRREFGEWLREDRAQRVRERQREQGVANYRRALEADRGSPDFPALVLDGLLPHKNTEFNRQRGAWIHIAPAINRDVKQWFEGAGWVEPEDWPAVTSALLDLISAVSDGGPIDDACRTFLDSGHSRGLQAGMVSPILNAVAPDRCVVVNAKVQRVVNHFTGEKYTTGLDDYAALSSKAQELADNVDMFGEFGDEFGQDPRDVFDAWCHWLVAERGFQFGTAAVWKIAPGRQATEWERCRDEGYIGVGWDITGDLTGVSPSEWKELRGRLLEQHPKETEARLNQAYRFARRIEEGDYIVANRGTSEIVGIGIVVGPYYYVEGPWDAHRYPVDWIDTNVRAVKEGGWKMTLARVKKKGALERFLSAPIVEASEPPPPPHPEPLPVGASTGGVGPSPGSDLGEPILQPSYTLQNCAADLNVPERQVEAWLRAINRKKQAAFYGPPGTGKTFVAQKLAKHLVADSYGFDDLVQFHPAYSYEDFIQGIRPQSVNGQLSYPVVPGRLLDFCKQAEVSDGPCVLIVDEINRANLARVFGELMYLLEYRDQKIPLAGGGELKIPDNVRIIGTMNTADRSIALVDHALRRRFAFLALYPDLDVLRKYHAKSDFRVENLVGLLESVNRDIDDPNYAVGISFFLHQNIGDHIQDIWEMEIEPYLEEYFFDRPEQVETYRWAKVRRRFEDGG